MKKPKVNEHKKIQKLGYYSNSIMIGLVVAKEGLAPCICSGGRGHMAAIPKILITYGDTIKF